MDIQFSGNPKPFGTIGLVIAIFSLIFSIIPCIGFYAVIPSIISIIFCLIAYLYARQNNQPRNVPLSGMIIGVLAAAIGIYQYVQYKSLFDAKSKIETELNKVVEEKVLDKLKEELEKDSVKRNAEDSIK